mmetsp:Transcript_9899/g.28506  ORF Transcript_9899/g.28506 Transcript_9899/m.28506 type:complete len:226 (+) Transcript_9899:590-1267(+)
MMHHVRAYMCTCHRSGPEWVGTRVFLLVDQPLVLVFALKIIPVPFVTHVPLTHLVQIDPKPSQLSSDFDFFRVDEVDCVRDEVRVVLISCRRHLLCPVVQLALLECCDVTAHTILHHVVLVVLLEVECACPGSLERCIPIKGEEHGRQDQQPCRYDSVGPFGHSPREEWQQGAVHGEPPEHSLGVGRTHQRTHTVQIRLHQPLRRVAAVVHSHKRTMAWVCSRVL